MLLQRGVNSGAQLTTLIISVSSFIYRVLVKGSEDIKAIQKIVPPEQTLTGHSSFVSSVAVFPAGTHTGLWVAIRLESIESSSVPTKHMELPKPSKESVDAPLL